MLPTEALTSLQGTLQRALFRDSCQVLRLSQVADGQGGHTDSWVLVGTAVACHVRPGVIPEREALSAARVTAVGSWLVRVPVATDVREADTLAVTSATRGGFALQVTGIRAPHSDDLGKQIEAVEID